jgi:hypothetical protein
MRVIEFALAYDFVDPADTSILHRLEFRHDDDLGATDPHLVNPVGQLWAVVRGFHPLRGTALPVSRDGVRYNDVVAAIGRVWPWRGGYQIDLAQIRDRLHQAGLGAPGWVDSERGHGSGV